MRRFTAAILTFLLGCASDPVREPRATVTLHALFTDGMVLQSDLAAPVWGTAGPGEEISVSIAGRKKTATAGVDGKWSLRMEPLKAGGPHELTVAGGTTLTVRNVLVGEVWVCSGQSNMEWSVNASANPAEEKAAAQFPKIRLFTVPKKQADAPQSDVVGSWKECSPETVGSFSAVAYFFGRELHRKLNVPIGLIHTSWGGTAAEVWTSRRALEANEILKPIVEGHAKVVENYEKALVKHKEDAEKAKAEGKPAPRAPGKPMAPSCLYNAMIAPLLPYGIKGAIWYQGESNAGRAKAYQTLFPAMIENWRQDWGQGAFPFGFVQLANFMARKDQPGESNWAELREAQTMTLSAPNTGMAVIIDIGDAKDIHPKNKQDVGLRLALWARSQVYGQDGVYSGPLYASMKVEAGKVRLAFKHVGGGLAAKGERLAGFSIAGEDRNFVWADASIEGSDVLVWSSKVEKPVAVRYAWADNPDCNLINKEGLPASPFRTDAWPRSLLGSASFGGNELSEQEKKDGWILLFNGKDADGWTDRDGAPVPARHAENGALNPHPLPPGHMVWSKEKFSDFVLACDFKVGKDCNSGIFFRTGDIKDPVQNGFEIQVFDSAGREKLSKHDCGALYDAVAPSKNAMKPAGEWNRMEITADRSRVKVVLNGETVVEADLDRWTEAGLNPDGSKNKFKVALKDFPREGHIGLQDHKHPVWYRNIKLKRLR